MPGGDLATARDSLFIPIRLACDVDDLCRWVVNPQRQLRSKSIDEAGARRQATHHVVFHADHPNALTLDATHLSANHSAKTILEHLEALQRRETDIHKG